MEWAVPPDPDMGALAESCRVTWERDRPKLIAFDTETSGFEFHDEAFCVTVAWHGPDGIESHYIELDTEEHAELAETVMWEADTWIGHNIKFDINRVISKGLFLDTEIQYKTIHDTEALAHLDNEHRVKKLKVLAVDLLGVEDVIELVYKSGLKEGETYYKPREQWEIEEAKKWAKKKYGFDSVKEIGYDLLPRGTVVPYAIKDAQWTLELYDLLRPRVEQYDDLWGKYLEEMELTRVFIDMERVGMATREEYVNTKVREYSKKVLEHHWLIEELVGKTVRTGKIKSKERDCFFNPSSSSPDVGTYLAAAGFESESYDAAHLKQMDHPLARAILDLREDEKLVSTYFRPIQKETRDGIIHPSIRQHGTATGRVSAGKEQG